MVTISCIVMDTKVMLNAEVMLSVNVVTNVKRNLDAKTTSGLGKLGCKCEAMVV